MFMINWKLYSASECNIGIASVFTKLIIVINYPNNNVLLFLLAFRKTMKVNGQEYSLDLIDTAGQVSK